MPEAPNGVEAILLAAGAGSRFGGGKLQTSFLGRPLIEAALDALRESRADSTLAVIPPGAYELRKVCETYGTTVVENPESERGQSTSVRAGLAACGPETRAAVVALADQPLVGPEAVGRLVGAFEDGAEVAVATYGGKRRNPVLFAREVWPELLEELSGDEGARGFLRERPELIVGVPCEDVAGPDDVDTPEDLRRLETMAVMDKYRKGRVV